MKNTKRKFTPPERYAVWVHHQKRCWWCKQTLAIEETTVDHFIPESFINNEEKRSSALQEYGLPDDFNINGFENWLPCHNHCNQAKGNRTFSFVPGHQAIVERLLREAPKVRKSAERLSRNQKHGELFTNILTALEKGLISVEDLDGLIRDFRDTAADLGGPELIRLDSGLWLDKNDIARESECCCKRQACVGHNGKVNCVFSKYLPEWVVTTGLYWQCYDEAIECNRCHENHKRGHIGKKGVCSKPYLDQRKQKD